MSFVTVALAAIVSMSEEMKIFGNLSTIVQTNFQKKSKGKYIHVHDKIGRHVVPIDQHKLFAFKSWNKRLKSALDCVLL